MGGEGGTEGEEGMEEKGVLGCFACRGEVGEPRALCGDCASSSVRELIQAIVRSRKKAKGLQSQMEAIMISREQKCRAARQARTQATRLAHLRQKSDALEHMVGVAHASLADRRVALEERRRTLNAASERLRSTRSDMLLGSLPDQLRCHVLQLHLLTEQKARETRNIVRRLRSIIPVRIFTQTSTSSSSSSKGRRLSKLQIRVGDVVLPSDTDTLTEFSRSEGQAVACALGNTLMLLMLLSKYTFTPLLCKPLFKGSTSSVHEESSVFATPMPLFLPHVERDVAREVARDVSAKFDTLASRVSLAMGGPPLSAGISNSPSKLRPSSSSMSPERRMELRDFRHGIHILRRSIGALCEAGFCTLQIQTPSGFDPLVQLAVLSSLLCRVPTAAEHHNNSGSSSSEEHRTPASALLSESCMILPTGQGQAGGGGGGGGSGGGAYRSQVDIAALVMECAKVDSDTEEAEVEEWETVEKPMLPPRPEEAEELDVWERCILGKY